MKRIVRKQPVKERKYFISPYIYSFLASGFGTGYLPFMPGTWGSIVGVFISWLLLSFGYPEFLWATLVTFLLGWYFSHHLIKQQPTNRDPSYIVIDEIAGVFLTYALIELLGCPLCLSTLGIGFGCFRLFDIWKPFPINWIDDKFSSSLSTAGLGVMIDDLLAAFPAAFLTFLLLAL